MKCGRVIHGSVFILHDSSLITQKLVVHLGSTNGAGSRVAVEAPVRRPDGTWNIKFTVAVFRPWRGSPAFLP